MLSEAGNALISRFSLMPLDIKMTLALLQELLMGLRANDAEGYKSWLALVVEELERDIAVEVESNWMVPLLVEGDHCQTDGRLTRIKPCGSRVTYLAS